MDKVKLTYLWHQYLKDASSSAELQELESALLNKDLENTVNEVLKDIYKAIPQRDIIDMTGSDAKDKALAYIIAQPQNKRPVKLWSFITAAAIILLIAGLSIFVSRSYFGPDIPGSLEELAKHDIEPGSHAATITLANGKSIGLSGAKSGVVINAASLSYNDGTKIKDADLSQSGFQIISTPNGGKYQVVLADGTKVWLNAASSIKFRSGFQTLSARTIELTGEAYFEVFKDKKHPFIVKCQDQELEVLGTHFNISAYQDEAAVKTTLLEGSVRVSSLLSSGRNSSSSRANAKDSDSLRSVTLKPNQQAILTGSRVQVVQADLENAMAWRNDDFVFKGEDFKTTMRKIARWYNVEIVYDADLDNGIELGGWVSRNSKLSEVLSRIEQAGNVHFKVEGRRIFVRK